MPSGLSEAPNSGGDTSSGGGSYDANNPDVFNDPRTWANLPQVRTDGNGDPDYSGIWDDLNNIPGGGDVGGDRPISYDALSPTLSFDQMYNIPQNPFNGDKSKLDFQKYSVDALDAADNYGTPEDGFWGTPLGKNLKKFGMFALSMHPATRTPMALYNMYNAFQNGDTGNVVGGLVNAVTKNPLAGTLAGMGTDALSGKPMNTNSSGQLGATLGGMFGSQVAGPMGGFVGQQLGQTAGRNLGARAGLEGGGGNAAPQGDFSRQMAQAYTTPNQTAIPKTSQMTGSDAMINSLAALYMYNQQRQDSKSQVAAQQNLTAQQQAMLQQYMDQAGQIQPEMHEPDFGSVYAKMDEMYNPSGTIARDLRQTLERKDAAAGRRSQYGPREVELLSRLSQLRSQYEPGYLNAAANEANSYNSMATADANSRRAALQAALQAQNGMSTSQAAALNAQAQANAARTQQQQQFLNSIYTIGRDQNWWGMFDGE